jgi:TM2 domain-containing membrane protein YozV
LTVSYVGVSGQGLITILVFFLTAIWILYFMRSRRVLATFNR